MEGQQGAPTIKEVVLGSAKLKSEQRANTAAYRQRIAQGKIFGTRTDEFLGTEGTINDRIEAYFRDVEKGIDGLGQKYNLEGIKHAGGDFAAIKEEVMRLMWVYGIKIEIFNHDQRGLLLLGAASTNLHLKGKGESYARERKRTEHAIRMIVSSFWFQDTSSVKVSKWITNMQAKADAIDDPVIKDKYQKRADSERHHTKDGYLSEQNASVKDQVIEGRDESATADFNARYRTMPHLIRVQQRLGLSEMPSLQWIVTRYSKKEFSEHFNQAAAFVLNPSICLSRETDEAWSRNLQQHEMHHALTEQSITFHLGSGIQEGDAERATDIPTLYPHQRALGYYVDDVLDSKLQLTDTDSAYIIRQQAAINAKQGIYGSEPERRWNAMLIDEFGLEGYLTYYMLGANPNLHGQIQEQLLDVPTAAYRLSKYAAAYKGGNFTSLPHDMYMNKMRYEELLEESMHILSNGNNNMRPDFFAAPTKTTMEYPPETLEKLAERANAWWQITDENRARRMALKLEELAWMRQRYPGIYDAMAAMDSRYDVPIDVLNDIPQQNVSFSEQEFGDIQKLIKQTLNHISTSYSTGNEFDNTLKYIMLRLSSRDYDRDIDQGLQQRVGQALATAYRRLYDAMPGRSKYVAVEMRYVILDPIIKDGATWADFQTLLHNLERVEA